MTTKHKNKTRWFFIVNSTAGSGHAGKKINELILSLKKYGFDYDLEITKYAKHATELAKNAVKNGYGKIVAMGGDGTANEVINGIMQSGRAEKVVFGLIPEGGGNDFARMFNLSSDINEAVENLKHENMQSIDIGKVENYFFLNSLGMGFDAVVAQNSNKLKKIKGFASYLISILQALVQFTNYKAKIIIDGEKRDVNFTLFSVGNGRYCGGGFILTPNAKLNDGLLDVGIVTGLTRKRLLKILPQATKGKHLHNKEVEMLTFQKIEVFSDEELPLYIDGEIPELKDRRNFTIEVVKDKIHFLT